MAGEFDNRSPNSVENSTEKKSILSNIGVWTESLAWNGLGFFVIAMVIFPLKRRAVALMALLFFGLIPGSAWTQETPVAKELEQNLEPQTKPGEKDLVDLVDEVLQTIEQNRLKRASNIKTTISPDFVIGDWGGSLMLGNQPSAFGPKAIKFLADSSFTDSTMDQYNKVTEKDGTRMTSIKTNWSIQGDSLEFLAIMGVYFPQAPNVKSEVKYQGTLKRINDSLKGTIKPSVTVNSLPQNVKLEFAVTLTRNTPYKEETKKLHPIEETAGAIRDIVDRNQNKDKISQEDAMNIWREVQQYTEEEQKFLKEIARQKKDEELERTIDDVNRFLDEQIKNSEGGNQAPVQTKNKSDWYVEELRNQNSDIGNTLEVINVLGGVLDLGSNLKNVKKLEDLRRHVKDGKTLSGWLTKKLLGTNPYTSIYYALYKKPTESAFNGLENLGRTIQRNNDLVINELNFWERFESQLNSPNSIPDTNEDPPILKSYSKEEQEFANRFTDHVMDTYNKKGKKAAQKEMDSILKSIQSSNANIKALQKIKTKE